MQILNNDKAQGKNIITVPVLGCPRGGTSMIAGTLINLGVSMGDKLANLYQLEDERFKADIVTNQMITAVAQMDNDHDKWGFKYPNSIYYIRTLIPTLRNPHLVVVFRNHLSIAESSSERDKGKTFGPHLISTAHRHESAVTNFLTGNSFPAALYSFEAALNSPKVFVDSLINFLHLTPTKQQIQDAIDWIDPEKGYQDIRTFEAVNGHGEPIRKDS